MSTQAETTLNPIRRSAHVRRMLSHIESVAARPRRFVVECAHNSGNYIAEVDIDRTDATDTVKDILAGQFGRVLRVYELLDVSEEFAGRVAEQAKEEWWSDGVLIAPDAAFFCKQYDVDVREMEEPA